MENRLNEASPIIETYCAILYNDVYAFQQELISKDLNKSDRLKKIA